MPQLITLCVVPQQWHHLGQSQGNESPSILRKAFHLPQRSLGRSVKVIQSVIHQLFPAVVTELETEPKEAETSSPAKTGV